jgi:peptide deformylase
MVAQGGRPIAPRYTFGARIPSMAHLPIVRLGHPALRCVARAVGAATIAEPAFQALVDDMIDTMRGSHGVGLAAPQIGVAWQVFVYEVALPRRDSRPQGIPLDAAAVIDASVPADAPVPAGTPVAAGAADAGAATTAADAGEAPAAADATDAGDDSDPPLPLIPLHVLVNPMLTPQAGDLVYDWEGCLSIPDLRGLVPRHPAVRVRGFDRHGEPVDYLVDGFEARIVQHEYDHLNGVVFLDRMRDFKALAFRDEWELYMAGNGEESPSALPAAIGGSSEPGLGETGATAPVAAEPLRSRS